MASNQNVLQLTQQSTTDPTSVFYAVTGGTTDTGLPLSILSSYLIKAYPGFLQTGTGAVTRTIQAKFQDYLDAADFGVVCDGVTNNTVALTNAIQAAQAAGKPLYIYGNGKVCKTDWINYGAVAIANQISIIGDGVTLQKITSDGNPVMTIGSATATAFTGPIVIRGIIFSGIAGNTTAALTTYDLVRSSIENCQFLNSIVGHYSYGGISNTYTNCIFSANQIGWRGDTFSSLAGGGVPNLLTLVSCKFVNNTSYGGFYNGGNCLFVKNFDIETNGTTGIPGSGGFYVAPVSTGTGVVFDSGWFEANAGGQNLWLNGGNNHVISSMCIASPNATVDFNITGGTYVLERVICVNSKTNNITETGTAVGNAIRDCSIPNISSITTNTSIIGPSSNYFPGSVQIQGTVTGTGITSLFASPPAIGTTTRAAGNFTALAANGGLTVSGGAIISGGGSISVGTVSTTGTITPSTTSGIVGTTLADNANAGSVGEVISSTVLVGAAVALTTATPANITSISLTAGDWDVWGEIVTNPAGTTVQSVTQGSISTTSATFPTFPNGGAGVILPFSNTGSSIATPVGLTRINVSTTTTVYLVGQSTFTTSTNAMYGFIGARRVR